MAGRPPNVITIDWLMARAKRNENGCLIWQRGTTNGYGEVCENYVQELAHRKMYALHHKVVLAPDDIIMHDCDVKLCIEPTHLTKGDHQKNAEDMGARGLLRAITRLSESQVLEIRSKYKGGARIVDLAAEYDVHTTTIFDVVNGKTWRHLLPK